MRGQPFEIETCNDAPGQRAPLVPDGQGKMKRTPARYSPDDVIADRETARFADALQAAETALETLPEEADGGIEFLKGKVAELKGRIADGGS